MVNILPIHVAGDDGREVIVQVNQVDLPPPGDERARAAFLEQCRQQARDRVAATVPSRSESRK